MVEGARLESECAPTKGTEGSNPSHSADLFFGWLIWGFFDRLQDRTCHVA